MLYLLSLLMPVACEVTPPPNDRSAHASAIAALAEPADPTAALAHCEAVDPLRSPALASDCRWAIAEALAPTDAAAAAAVCSPLSGAAAEECWFIVAEGSGSGASCGMAGRYARDCRMHLLTTQALTWPRDLSAQAVSMRGAPLIKAAGVPEAELADAWMAVFRVVGSRLPPPVDRSACERGLTSGLREACQSAAEGVLHDRLSRARDAGEDLCEGELPRLASYVPDEAMDRILAERRAADLCDPAAVKPPPPGQEAP